MATFSLLIGYCVVIFSYVHGMGRFKVVQRFIPPRQLSAAPAIVKRQWSPAIEMRQANVAELGKKQQEVQQAQSHMHQLRGSVEQLSRFQGPVHEKVWQGQLQAAERAQRNLSTAQQDLAQQETRLIRRDVEQQRLIQEHMRQKKATEQAQRTADHVRREREPVRVQSRLGEGTYALPPQESVAPASRWGFLPQRTQKQEQVPDVVRRAGFGSDDY